MLAKKIKHPSITAFLLGTLLVACSQENILAKRESQLNLLTIQAENESEKIQPEYTENRDSITYLNNGLSLNYFANSTAILANNESLLKDSIQILSFAYQFNKVKLTESEIQGIKLRLEHFSQLQQPVFQTSKKLLYQTNDSMRKYKVNLKQKLKEKLISVSDYDQLMTESSKNFVLYLRQSYEENKIIVTASKNYRQVLSDIQSVLTEKQWEEFFSCVYKK